MSTILKAFHHSFSGNSRFFIHAALFFSSLLASAQYSAVKLLIPGYISALAFLSLRIPIAFLVFFSLKSLATKEKVEKKDLKILFLCGLFGVVINQMGYFKGMEYTLPIHGALIMTTCPITIYLINIILVKGRLNWTQTIGIGLGFGGAFLLLLGKESAVMAGPLDTTKGDGLMFLNAIAYSFFLVLQKKIAHKYHPLTIISYVFLFGGMLVVPWGMPALFDINWTQLPSQFWFVFVFIVLFTTIVAYLINSWALRKVEPQVVGVYIYLQPILASLIAVAMGQDTLSWQKVMYGSMILIGVYLVGRQKGTVIGQKP
jgi:drug/metabolite transporter (DMT)-like permease